MRRGVTAACGPSFLFIRPWLESLSTHELACTTACAHTRTRGWAGKGLRRTYVRSEKAKPNLLFYTVCVSTPICAALDQAEKRPFSFFFLLFSPLFFLSFFFFSSSLFAARKEVAPNKFPAESFSALCSARTMAPR